MRKITIFLALLSATPVAAQTNSYFERILLPITVREMPGAFGSVWQSEFWMRNDSDVPAVLIPEIVSDRPPTRGMTFQPRIFLIRPGLGYPPGQFVDVTREAVDGIRFYLRIKDISRQGETYGTQIPVVRERDLFTSKLVLISVPTDDRFRQALRIYDGGREPVRFRVSVFENNGTAPLAVEEVGLPRVTGFGYTEILSLTDHFPAIRATPLVRIEIEPLAPGASFWAFVAVTHNETQHVTTIVP